MPVRVRNPQGGLFTKNSDLVLDWFIENEGPNNVTGDYFIDIYVDEVLADRWEGGDISPSHFVFIEGYTGLLDKFELAPGPHIVKLVVDPTNQIHESSESDNMFAAAFDWAGEAVAAPPEGTRLPNLSVTAGAGDRPPMIVSPFAAADSSGGLSIHGETHISLSILNDSPVPIEQSFTVTILMDDMVVRRASYSGLLGGNVLELDWTGLDTAIPITAGLHTIKVIADSTGIITESNEADNAYELELAWGGDAPLVKPEPLPAPEAPARTPQALANLTAYVPYGWDAAIAVSNSTDELDNGLDSPVRSSDAVKISFAIRNNSRVSSASSGAFKANVLVDNEIVGSKLFSAGSDAGAFWKESVTVPANRFSSGLHLVKVVIDSDQTIPEDSETDNEMARYVNWLPSSTPDSTATDFTLTNEQIDTMLAPMLDVAFVDQMRSASSPELGLPDWIPAIESAGKAGYYLLTGNDLDTERIVIHLLPHDQFLAASLDACMSGFGLLSDPAYTATFSNCLQFRGEIGFEKRFNGKNHVYVDLGESPIAALGTYFHEVGHAHQDLANPALSTASRTANIKGLLEGQAQLFEAAALRAIEDHSGISFMRYPDAPTMRSAVSFSLHNTAGQVGSPEHTLGYKILWMESLANTSGLGTNAELLNNKRLAFGTAKALYDYLVAKHPSEIDLWLSEIFAVSTRVDQFMSISLARLEADRTLGESGNPGLLEPAFLAP